MPSFVQLWALDAMQSQKGGVLNVLVTGNLPDDIADACLFLASPGARWIAGANLIVDGGVLTKQIF